MLRSASPVRIAYLIVAYDNPYHLARLVNALRDGSSKCFIHIDRKSQLERFSHIAGEDIHFSNERISIQWGDFSLVEAILALMRQALNEWNEFQYGVLLGEGHYPLQPTSCIARYLEHRRKFSDEASKLVDRLDQLIERQRRRVNPESDNLETPRK